MNYCPINLLEDYVGMSGIRPHNFIDVVVDKVGLCSPTDVYALAVKYREERQDAVIPFVLIYAMIQYKRHRTLVDLLIVDTVKTVEDVMTFISIYRRGSDKLKLASCVKRGIASIIPELNLMDFPDWNVSVWLLKMFHPVPKDVEQSRCWKIILEGKNEKVRS